MRVAITIITIVMLVSAQEECDVNAYSECATGHFPDNIQELQGMESPDCRGIEAMVAGFMGCVEAIPHCCEWLEAGTVREMTAEDAAFAEKCPNIFEKMARCDTAEAKASAARARHNVVMIIIAVFVVAFASARTPSCTGHGHQ